MKIKGKKAISLIVLVITILVLSILAATVIISLSNTNIISEANDAVKKTEAQQLEEAKSIMYADGILGNNPEAIVIGDTTLTWDAESETIIEKATSNGVTTVDKVTIPDGFYYVGGTKDTGLVISDNAADENKGVSYTCEGNQFVWVPVEYTATGVTDENGLDTGFTTVFKRGSAVKNSDGIYKMTGTLEEEYIEPLTGSLATFYELEWCENEYNDMCESVAKYNGFYIARFEAGDQSGVTVSKKGMKAYDNVKWGEYYGGTADDCAVYLSHNMYTNSESVVSTLCYSVQWDATMNFVSDLEHDITDSTLWGNKTTYDSEGFPLNSSVKETGVSEEYKAKNIYDLAGNVEEWCMEWCKAGYPCYRGDGVSDGGGPSLRVTTAGTSYVGFRVTLYLK